MPAATSFIQGVKWPYSLADLEVVLNKFLSPQWPVSAKVKSVSTTRSGGISHPPYDGLNLGIHVGDNPDTVWKNRKHLEARLTLPGEPVWLNQVHGTDVLCIGRCRPALPTADAVWTDQTGCVLAVMTADCLPVLLASKSGDVVAAVHCGWRGLLDGILQKTVKSLPVNPSQVLAWLGPAIGPLNFEVGVEVRDAFISNDEKFDECFVVSRQADNKYYADIFKLGRRCLHAAGVHDVFGGGVCTVQDRNYFSHRRDLGQTGRMASLIWIEDSKVKPSKR